MFNKVFFQKYSSNDQRYQFKNENMAKVIAPFLIKGTIDDKFCGNASGGIMPARKEKQE
jgi:hypothetical protein